MNLNLPFCPLLNTLTNEMSANVLVSAMEHEILHQCYGCFIINKQLDWLGSEPVTALSKLLSHNAWQATAVVDINSASLEDSATAFCFWEHVANPYHVIASTIKVQHVSNELQFRISTRVRLHRFLFEHELCFFFPHMQQPYSRLVPLHVNAWGAPPHRGVYYDNQIDSSQNPLLKHLTFVLSCVVLERRLIVPRIPILVTLDLSLVTACAGIATPIIFLAAAATFAAFMSIAVGLSATPAVARLLLTAARQW
jgi:hypothetical protein